MYRKFGNTVEFSEFIQDGWFGLRDALGKFDPSRGVKFATYASQRIAGAMLDGVRGRDHASRSSRIRGTAAHLTSIDSRIYNHGDKVLSIADTLDDERSAAAVGSIDDQDTFDGMLRGLSRTERSAVTLYYREDLRMKEIGAALGLSESRVSQIISSVLPRIRINVIRQREEEALCQ